MFSVENILVFGGKSPERVPPDVFYNTPLFIFISKYFLF